MEQLTDEHLPEDMGAARHGDPEYEAALSRGDVSLVGKWINDKYFSMEELAVEIKATLDIIQEATEHLNELLQIGRPRG